MATERIIIDIDDAAVDVAIAKLQMWLTLSQKSLGTPNVARGIQRTQQATDQLQFTLTPVTNQMDIVRHRLAQLGTKDLPSLTRELRVILGTMPGMRQAMQSYFGFKREYTAIGAAIETGVIGPGLILATLTTLVLMFRGLEARFKQMRQKQQEQDRWIKRTTGLYRDEYDRKLKIWAHYARSNPG